MSATQGAVKPWWKNWKIWAVIVPALLVLGVIANLLGYGDDDDAEAEPTTGAVATQVEEVVETEEPESTPEAAYLEGWAVDDVSEITGELAPYYAITKFEDVSSTTVRVYVQEHMDKDVAEHLGKNVLSIAGYTVDDLTTVVVQGADGIDINVFG